MWTTLTYVATPVSLAAFVAAVLVTAYRARLKQQIRMLESVPEAQRAEAISRLEESYHLKTDNLTRSQRFELVRETLRQRNVRLQILARSLMLITLIIASAVVVVSIVSRVGGHGGESSDNTRKRTVPVPVAAGATLRIDKVELFGSLLRGRPVRVMASVNNVEYVYPSGVPGVEWAAAIEGMPEQSFRLPASHTHEVRFRAKVKLEDGETVELVSVKNVALRESQSTATYGLHLLVGDSRESKQGEVTYTFIRDK